VLAATLAFCAIKAWRWGRLLADFPGIAYRDLHSAVYLGLAANFLLSHIG
jgi:hypothetical protein